MAWNSAVAKTLLPVLLQSQMTITLFATVERHHQAIQAGDRCT